MLVYQRVSTMLRILIAIQIFQNLCALTFASTDGPEVGGQIFDSAAITNSEETFRQPLVETKTAINTFAVSHIQTSGWWLGT